MKKGDLLQVCLQNLFRHKARTILTVMGVVLGCCSVIIMLSMGIGMKQAQEQALSMMGDLTIIQVYSQGKGKKTSKITDRTMETIKAIPGVTAATPRLTADQLPVTVYAGKDRRYRCLYLSAAGIRADAAEQMGYRLLEGSWNTAGRTGFWWGRSLLFYLRIQNVRKEKMSKNLARNPSLM